MSIETYSQLAAAIQDYNDDASSIISLHLDDFVMLAEKRIAFGMGGGPYMSEPIRCRAMEADMLSSIPVYVDAGTSAGTANAQTLTAATVLTATAGVAVFFVADFTNTGAMTVSYNGVVTGPVKTGVNLFDVDAGDIVKGMTYALYFDGTNWLIMPGMGSLPLPNRFLGMRTVYSGTDNLDFVHSDDFDLMRDGSYTIEGNALRLASGIAASSQLKVKYYRQFKPLKTSLNDMFLAAPNIYLWGTLLETSIYLVDNDNAAKWFGLFAGAVNGYLNSDKSDSEGRTRLFLNTHKAII